VTSRNLLPLLLLTTLGVRTIAGCKRKGDIQVVPPAPVAAASAPAANAAPASLPAPAKAFEITSVPMSNASIPPFPYIERPEGTDGYFKAGNDFDRAWVIAGDELRAVEGRTSERWFPPSAGKMSMLVAFRNYETAIISMGGVRVDNVHPLAPDFIARNGGDQAALLKNCPFRTATSQRPMKRPPSRSTWCARRREISGSP
jgi:OOP family OmpA-OmpF porin